MPPQGPFVLCILDGWGVASPSPSNGIALAHTPFWDSLPQTCPFTTLEASGDVVGLPSGQMGNSEVGHLTLGSGRTILQDLPRINQAITEGTFLSHPLLSQACQTVKQHGKALHVIGLLSDGGVHSHLDHFTTLLTFLGRQGVTTWIHAFLDGRDVAPQSAPVYVRSIQELIQAFPTLQWASLGGRAFGMDRNTTWERTKFAYQGIVDSFPIQSRIHPDGILETIELAYQNGVLRDEEIPPFGVKPYGGMQPGDGVIFMNFRVDRIRQLASALLDPDFCHFSRDLPKVSHAISLTEISTHHTSWIDPLFPQNIPEATLGAVLEKEGRRQLRLAETEKYAHVTFFFNGGREDPFQGETRLLIPSPRVASYDLKPEMSAFEVTDRLLKIIEEDRCDFILVNYANADMVGHTAQKKAIIRAVETLDLCLKKLTQAVTSKEGMMLITADHGNAEIMEDPQTNIPHTAHTCSRVPCVLVNGPPGLKLRSGGSLRDVAPTILKLMGLPVPENMQGHPLMDGGRCTTK